MRHFLNLLLWVFLIGLCLSPFYSPLFLASLYVLVAYCVLSFFHGLLES